MRNVTLLVSKNLNVPNGKLMASYLRFEKTEVTSQPSVPYLIILTVMYVYIMFYLWDTGKQTKLTA